jgi:hypothetical protein
VARHFKTPLKLSHPGTLMNKDSIRPKANKTTILLVFLSVFLATASVVAFLTVPAYSQNSRDVYATTGLSLWGNQAAYWKSWAMRQAPFPSSVQDEISEADAQQIQNDIRRLGTSDSEQMLKIQKILTRQVQIYKETGYVQGMGHVAALIVKTVGKEENDDVLFQIFHSVLIEVHNLVSLDYKAKEYKAAADWIYETVLTISPDFIKTDEDENAIKALISSTVPSIFVVQSSSANVARLWSVMMAAHEINAVTFKQYLLLFTAVILATQQPHWTSGSLVGAYDNISWNFPAALKATNNLIAEIKSGACTQIALF